MVIIPKLETICFSIEHLYRRNGQYEKKTPLLRNTLLELMAVHSWKLCVARTSKQTFLDSSVAPVRNPGGRNLNFWTFCVRWIFKEKLMPFDEVFN